MGFCLYLQKKNVASTTGIVSETSSPTLSTTYGTNYPVGSLPEAEQVQNNQFGFPSTALPFAGADPTIPATQLEEVQVTASKLPQYSLSPERLAQIDAAYSGDIKELNIARKSASGDSGTITTYKPDEAPIVNRAKYLYNKLLQGVGSVASGLGDVALQGASVMSTGATGTGDVPLNLYRQQIAPDIRNYLKETIGSKKGEEREGQYNRETFTGALGGLAQSVPAMAATAVSGGVGGGAMFLQSYDNALESIDQSEAGRNLDDVTKTIFATTVGTVTSALEKYGFDKIFKGETGVISNLIAQRALKNASKETGEKVTGDVLSRFLDKELVNLSNKFVKGGAKALDGALIEYGTEAAQEGVQAEAEILTNKLTGKPVFDISETSKWDGFLARMNKAGIAGAIGGGLLGGVAGLANLSKGDVVKQEQQITDIDNALANESLSDASREILVQRKIDLQNKLQETAGKIDEAYDKLDDKQKDEVNGIVEQKVKLQEAIADPALSEDIKKSLSTQSEDLDKQLSEIKPVEGAKESKAIENTNQTKEVVTEPKTASNEETSQVTEQQVPKAEETVAKTGEEISDDVQPKIGDDVEYNLNGEVFKGKLKAITPNDEYVVTKPDGTDYTTNTLQNFKPISEVVASEPQTNKNIVEEAYKSNKEIESVGDTKQYKNYVKSIFPESQTKEPMYHGSPNEFENFDLGKLGENSKNTGYFGEGLYFTPKKSMADAYGDKTYRVVLDTKNPFKKTAKNFEDLYERLKDLGMDKKYFDGRALALITQAYPQHSKRITQAIKDMGYDSVVDWNETIVFDPKQVHILGTKNDANNFKQFVEGNKVQSEKPKYTIKGETVVPKAETINEKINKEETQNAIQEQSTGSVLQRQQEETGTTGGERGGMEQGEQGQETTQPPRTKEVQSVNEQEVKPSFDELATRSLEGDVVKNTLSNVERETNTKLDKTISEYNAADFKSAFVQGEQTVQAAKEEFGKDYVSKFTDYVKESKMPFENKAVMLVSLENDLRKQYLENPTPQLKKQVDLATKNSIEFLRSSARATGVGIFRQAARANYETEQAAEAIFSPKERQERTKVEEAVQSTSEDVQKEYEARQETQTDADVQEAIDKGVQARIDDIYEALPSSRKQAADKAISALDRIQKKLRSKTYDASIGVPIAIIDAGITTIKQAIKAGVKVADAIELGINKIKEKYGKAWKNEDKFRKDMLEGFSDENIDVNDGTRTSKTSDKLKQELIDAGYGKEITVTTKNGKEKRNIVDWKKLTGVEGSFDRMKENLEESFKKKGYSEEQINEFQKQLEDEYNDIHADIIQKSLNELNRRNTPREATAKTLARRLAELYNLGLYDRDVDTYSNILNNALGISPKSQAAFNEIRDFNRSLAQLLDSRGVNGKPLTDLEIITAENEIKAHIQKVIQKVQFAEGNGFFKFSDVMKNIFSAMQRMMLAKISQLIENPFSGALNDTQVKLQDAFSKQKWDTKELRENRAMLGRAIYEDASLRGGDEYGGVGNPFTTKNSIESFINGLSKNAMYQAFVGALSGRQYLDATDSYFKIKRTEKEFTNNLLRILTDKTNPNGAMDQNDALRFVSEALTGQSFEQAKTTARNIITSINEKADKEIIRPAETNVTRIANDLVKDNLVLGGKMTMNEVESAFKAAYKTAGKSIGHESNNILTDVVNATNQSIQRKLDEALKKKDWSTAAWLNLTSILSKNIVNPFVGGGTNWTVIGLQKMGLPTEWIRSDVGFSKKPIDLATKEGLKELKDNLSANATRQRQFGRIMTGTLTALAAVMAVRYSGDEEEYKKWLKDHPESRKLINKIQPVPLTLYLARDNKNAEFIKAIANTLGSRYNVQTDQEKLFKAVGDFWDGYDKGNDKKTQKAWGTVGQLMGRRFNIPYVSSISNYGDMGNKLYKEFVGKPVKDPYKAPKGFAEGYFKGGLMDYLNIAPQDLKEDKK